MTIINMLEAKSQLSRLVQAVESGKESEIVIARNGRPAARLVPIAATSDASKRLGLVEGKFPPVRQDDFDRSNDEIDMLFRG